MEKRLEDASVIANSIRENIERRLYTLDFDVQCHFATRMYRVTGDKSYTKPIVAWFLAEKEKLLTDLKNASSKRYVSNRSEELFEEYKMRVKRKAGRDVKEVKRIKLFSTRKESLFYYRIIENLYFLKNFGLSKGKLGCAFKRGLTFLRNRKDEIKNYIFEDSAIKYYGTQLINQVNYLKFLGVVDVIPSFENKFIKMFMKRKRLPDYMYRNKIYGLTHFIIADSDYYQRFASKRFMWIIDYFRNNIGEIIGKTNADIISEVGLCFKLMRVKDRKVFKLVTNYLLNAYDGKIGYIPRDDSKDLNIAEHTNIVAFLFLHNFRRFYKGPDIRNIVEQFITP